MGLLRHVLRRVLRHVCVDFFVKNIVADRVPQLSKYSISLQFHFLVSYNVVLTNPSSEEPSSRLGTPLSYRSERL